MKKNICILRRNDIKLSLVINNQKKQRAQNLMNTLMRRLQTHKKIINEL